MTYRKLSLFSVNECKAENWKLPIMYCCCVEPANVILFISYFIHHNVSLSLQYFCISLEYLTALRCLASPSVTAATWKIDQTYKFLNKCISCSCLSFLPLIYCFAVNCKRMLFSILISLALLNKSACSLRNFVSLILSIWFSCGIDVIKIVHFSEHGIVLIDSIFFEFHILTALSWSSRC